MFAVRIFDNRLLTSRREDDTKWPQKNKDGRQELEIRLGSEHISFEVGLLILLQAVRY